MLLFRFHTFQGIRHKLLNYRAMEDTHGNVIMFVNEHFDYGVYENNRIGMFNQIWKPFKMKQ